MIFCTPHLDIPQLDGAVLAARDEQPRVAGPGQPIDGPDMATECALESGVDVIVEVC